VTAYLHPKPTWEEKQDMTYKWQITGAVPSASLEHFSFANGSRQTSGIALDNVIVNLDGTVPAGYHTANVSLTVKDKDGEPVATGSTDAKFTVLNVEITEPKEDDVYLHGSKCTFKAKVFPDTLSVDKWKWEIIEGKADPMTGDEETFDPIVLNEDKNYEEPDDLKVKVTATIQGIDVSDEIKIKVVYPRIEKINFAGLANIIHEGGSWPEHSKNNPEWLDVDHDNKNDLPYQSVSVFKKKEKIRLTATLKVKEALNNDTEIDELYADCDWMAIGDPDCKNKNKITFPAGKTEHEVKMIQTGKLKDYVYDYAETAWFWRGAIKYDWKYKINDEEYWIDPDEADNIHHIYVVRDNPLQSTVFETVLHITCEAAWGKKSEKKVVKAIWNEFKDCDVRRKDGKILTYYWYGRNYSTEGEDFKKFLKVRHGRCGLWGRLLRESFFTHKIFATKKIIHGKNMHSFLIKRWRFGPKLILKTQIFWSDPSSGIVYGDPDGDCVNLRGVSGQGNNPEPPEVFGDHVLVLYDGDIYDPSYGLGPYKYDREGQNKYENDAIAGYSPLYPPRSNCIKNDKKKIELKWTDPINP
jgi:hypothetical protein